jgi:hypothetical protein
LLNIETQQFHVKNWRPNILVFTGQPHNRERLAQVAEWLTLGRGIVTFSQLLVGDVDQLSGRGLRETARKNIRKYIKDRRMTAFAEVDVVSNFYEGAVTIAQANGTGALEANTVLLGWSGMPEGRTDQLRLLRSLVHLKKSVLLLNFDEERRFGRQQVIDVWWGGRGGNADMMLILAYLIQQHRAWHDAQIRLLRVINSPDGYDQCQDHMKQLLSSVRVNAEPMIITRPNTDQSLVEIISENSRNTDLTLLGMQVPAIEHAEAYGQYLEDLMQSAGTVLLVRSAQPEDLLDTE